MRKLMSDKKKLSSVGGVESLVVEKSVSSDSLGKKEKIDDIKAKEFNGPKGLEPTRYGDWESKGRCYDF